MTNSTSRPRLPERSRKLSQKKCDDSFLRDLGMLGTTEIRVRSGGVELHKQVVGMKAIACIDDEAGLPVAICPELGLAFSLDRLTEAHGCFRPRRAFSPILELDFQGQVSGLSFGTRADTPAGSHLRKLIERHHSRFLFVRAWRYWRSRRLARHTAPETSGAEDGEAVVFRILEHAVSTRQPLYCRVRGAHADLTSWIIASELHFTHDRIRCADTCGELILKRGTGLRLSLSLERLDGDSFSTARLLDADGNIVVQIGARNPRLLRLWQDFAASGPFLAEASGVDSL